MTMRLAEIRWAFPFVDPGPAATRRCAMSRTRAPRLCNSGLPFMLGMFQIRSAHLVGAEALRKTQDLYRDVIILIASALIWDACPLGLHRVLAADHMPA